MGNPPESVRRAGPRLVLQGKIDVGILHPCLGEESFNVGDGERRGSGDADLYTILGVEKASSDSDIKKAYKKLALRWHPDKNPNCESCQEKFRAVSRAYETLGDKSKRRLYDTTAALDMENLPSAATTLTHENYRQVVLGSPSVWVIQTYSEAEGRSRSFHGHWEEVVREWRIVILQAARVANAPPGWIGLNRRFSVRFQRV